MDELKNIRLSERRKTQKATYFYLFEEVSSIDKSIETENKLVPAQVRRKKTMGSDCLLIWDFFGGVMEMFWNWIIVTLHNLVTKLKPLNCML